MKSSELTIGQLGRRFGLATHVLRHWESVGLLAPARAAGGQRRYGEDDLFRIAVILMSKEVGVGLRDVAEFLASGGDKDVLRRHLAVLQRRIDEAQAAKKLIEHALECPLKLEECPDAREEIATRIPPP
ncbi:MerR family transcriptional regulator [Amycolatopsis sp. NPDC048633]|uniref:MerR family transcriptional regulator n=1 Tax=Amycolatopsis sp. NPDC048633 TaxID=3157095 RepID=UPI00340C239F